MSTFSKNLLLFILVIILSISTTFHFSLIATYFTSQDILYASFLPVLLMGSVGGSLSVTFFLVFIFSLGGFKKNKSWIIFPLIPYALMWLNSDIIHIYLPVLVGLVAYALAFCSRRIYSHLIKTKPQIM